MEKRIYSHFCTRERASAKKASVGGDAALGSRHWYCAEIAPPVVPAPRGGSPPTLLLALAIMAEPYSCDSSSEEASEARLPLGALEPWKQVRSRICENEDYALLPRSRSKERLLGADSAQVLQYVGWRYKGTLLLSLWQHLRAVEMLTKQGLRSLRFRKKARQPCSAEIAGSAHWTRSSADRALSSWAGIALPKRERRLVQALQAPDDGVLLKVQAAYAGLREATVSRALRSLPVTATIMVAQFEAAALSTTRALWAGLRTDATADLCARATTSFSQVWRLAYPLTAWMDEATAEEAARRRALTQVLASAFRSDFVKSGGSGCPTVAVQEKLLVGKTHWARVLDNAVAALDREDWAPLVDHSTQPVRFPGRKRHFCPETLRRKMRSANAARRSRSSHQGRPRGKKRTTSPAKAALNRARTLLLAEGTTDTQFLEALRAVRRGGMRAAARRLLAARGALVERRPLVRLWLLPDADPIARHAAVEMRRLRAARSSSLLSSARELREECACERRLARSLARARGLLLRFAEASRRVRACKASHEARTRVLRCQDLAVGRSVVSSHSREMTLD